MTDWTRTALPVTGARVAVIPWTRTALATGYAVAMMRHCSPERTVRALFSAVVRLYG